MPRLRARHARGLRRLLAGAAVLEVGDAELAELQRDSSIAHISGDLPVNAGMAVTNKVTAAETVWQGTSGGLLGLFSTPGYTGRGVGVAILDSGIAPHTALDSRVVTHVNLVSGESTYSDLFGHGTHIAGIVGGNTTAASRVTTTYSGGSAPAVSLIDVRGTTAPRRPVRPCSGGSRRRATRR